MEEFNMKLNDELFVSINRSISPVYPLPVSVCDAYRTSVTCYPHNKIDPFIKTISEKLNEMISTVLHLKDIGSDRDLSCLSTLEKFLEYVNNDKEEGIYCIKHESSKSIFYKDIQLLKLDICEQEEVEKYHYVFNEKCELVLEKVMDKTKYIKLTDVFTNEQFGDLIRLQLEKPIKQLCFLIFDLINYKYNTPNPKAIEELYFDEQELDEDIRETVDNLLQHGHFMKCKDCGNPFYIMYDEEEWYTDRGFNIPKRCKTCRDKRRNK